MDSNKSHILDKARLRGLATPSAGLPDPGDEYFDAFAARLMASLPDRPELEHPDDVEAQAGPRSLWQTVRPYVYMAAMFAGVWLMLQLFTMITGTNKLQPMDTNPVLAEALGNDIFVDHYVYDDIDSWDLVDEIVDDGDLDANFEFVYDDLPSDVILPQ